MAGVRPRVMQSFKTPRPTTNPYITQLHRALAAEPGIRHLTFDWKTALTSRVDVLHLHWPEVMLEGDKAWKRWGKRVLIRALLLKHGLTGGRIVRTAHNVELPQDVDAATRRILERIERITDHRIVLNAVTAVADGDRATLIPHGHYRDWFAPQQRRDRVDGRVGYFGLIRRYKGVERLLEVYEAARSADDGLSLVIGGRPSSDDLRSHVESAAARVPGIETTLRFLDDAELVAIATSSQLVVLPYRFMHNSGGALAALSLDRPVLVPRNAVNELLAREVGDGWVHLYDGELTPERLREVLAGVAGLDGRPDLSAREWDRAGRAHAEVYQRALAQDRASGV